MNSPKGFPRPSDQPHSLRAWRLAMQSALGSHIASQTDIVDNYQYTSRFALSLRLRFDGARPWRKAWRTFE
jgi:hypothetical protein